MGIFGGSDDYDDRSSLGRALCKPGWWSFSSKSDPRWNCSGSVEVLVISAGYPAEAEAALASMKKRYGKVPKDLHYSCMKE